MAERKQRLGPNQEKWLQALESGEHQQCRGELGVMVDGVEKNCCLGLACRVLGVSRSMDPQDGLIAYGGCDKTPPMSFALGVLGLRSIQGSLAFEKLKDERCLTEANDVGGATFAEIAAFCREHPEAVFTEPR